MDPVTVTEDAARIHKPTKPAPLLVILPDSILFELPPWIRAAWPAVLVMAAPDTTLFDEAELQNALAPAASAVKVLPVMVLKWLETRATAVDCALWNQPEETVLEDEDARDKAGLKRVDVAMMSRRLFQLPPWRLSPSPSPPAATMPARVLVDAPSRRTPLKAAPWLEKVLLATRLPAPVNNSP
jgi:hypothetical protein